MSITVKLKDIEGVQRSYTFTEGVKLVNAAGTGYEEFTQGGSGGGPWWSAQSNDYTWTNVYFCAKTLAEMDSIILNKLVPLLNGSTRLLLAEALDENGDAITNEPKLVLYDMTADVAGAYTLAWEQIISGSTLAVSIFGTKEVRNATSASILWGTVLRGWNDTSETLSTACHVVPVQAVDGGYEFWDDIYAGSSLAFGYWASGALKRVISGAATSVTADMLDGISEITQYAFAGCLLYTAELPDTITSIGSNAFLNSTYMYSFTCHATTPPTLQSDSITGISATCPIYVPAESVEAYKTAPYWSERASYIQSTTQ